MTDAAHPGSMVPRPGVTQLATLEAQGQLLEQQIRELRSLIADAEKRMHRAEESLRALRARIARLRDAARSRS